VGVHGLARGCSTALSIRAVCVQPQPDGWEVWPHHAACLLVREGRQGCASHTPPPPQTHLAACCTLTTMGYHPPPHPPHSTPTPTHPPTHLWAAPHAREGTCNRVSHRIRPPPATPYCFRCCCCCCCCCCRPQGTARPTPDTAAVLSAPALCRTCSSRGRLLCFRLLLLLLLWGPRHQVLCCLQQAGQQLAGEGGMQLPVAG
jgi:hypothetical protein